MLYTAMRDNGLLVIHMRISRLVLCGLLLWSTACLAEAEIPRDDGNRAFNTGDYARAEQIFRDLKARHPNDGAIAYSLASTLYRRGRYAAARSEFLRAARLVPESAPLCWYNAGLSSIRLDDQIAANHWLSMAWRKAAHMGLKKLAETTLRYAYQLSTEQSTVVAQFSTGWTDQVVLLGDAAEFEPTSGSDQVKEALLRFRSAAHRIGDFRLQLVGNAFGTWYQHTEGSELSLFSAGAAVDRSFGRSRVQIEAQQNYLYLGGDRYQTYQTYSAMAFLPGTMHFRLGYMLEKFQEGADLAEGTQGRQQSWTLGGRLASGPGNYDFSYRYQRNDRTSDTVSPERNETRLIYSRPIGGDLTVQLAWTWRRSQYPDDSDRDDILSRWELQAAYALGVATDLRVAARYTDNRSSVEESSFDQAQILLGLSRRFSW